MGSAYGFYEIPSTTAAISAIDIMGKAANVEFVTWEKKLGGRLVTVIIKGDVAAVTQAMEAAREQGIKKPAACVVLANPHEEVLRMIALSASKHNQTTDEGQESDGGECTGGESK